MYNVVTIILLHLTLSESLKGGVFVTYIESTIVECLLILCNKNGILSLIK